MGGTDHRHLNDSASNAVPDHGGSDFKLTHHPPIYKIVWHLLAPRTHFRAVFRRSKPRLDCRYQKWVPITAPEPSSAEPTTRKPSAGCRFVERPTPDGVRAAGNPEVLRGFLRITRAAAVWYPVCPWSAGRR